MRTRGARFQNARAAFKELQIGVAKTKSKKAAAWWKEGLVTFNATYFQRDVMQGGQESFGQKAKQRRSYGTLGSTIAVVL